MSFLKSKHSGWTHEGTRTPFFGGGGGGQQQPTTSYSQTSNIPDYAQPYVENMLESTQKQIYTTDPTTGERTGFRPYVPYSENADDYVAPFQSMQTQAQEGIKNLQVPDAIGAGAMGSFFAGQNYANQMQDPASMASYMNPYQQNVTDIAKTAAVREAQMAQNAGNLGAARQGTYGGARQTLANSERERNLMSNLSNIQAQGSNQAYQQAVANQQFGAGLNMQGYGQAAQLAGQGLKAQQDLYGLQNQYGGQQQAQEQQKISQAIQDFANKQQYPLMQLGTMSNMLRGLPMQSSNTNQYVAAPNALTQGIGLAGAGASIYNALKKEGGVIKEMASGGITSIPRYDVGGSVRAKLEMMPLEKLQSYKSESPAIQEMVEEILRDKTGKAGGGIIAFQNRGLVPEPISAETEERVNEAAVRQAYVDAAKMQAGNPPTFDTSVPSRAESRTPLTEKIGRALGIKDAGRQVPTKETTAMPMRSDGSDVPMVAGSSELTAAQKAPVSSKSIVAAAPAQRVDSDVPTVVNAPPAKVDSNKPTEAAPVKADAPTAKPSAAKPAAAPALNPTSIVAAKPASPTAGTKTPGGSIAAEYGLERPADDPYEKMSISEIAKEKLAFLGPDVRKEERAGLMAERANAKDEARRAQSLRFAEFFADWGSRPGSTIAAGLTALKEKIPSIVTDSREEAKIRRAINKDIAGLDKADRLEKAGAWDEAAKLKNELGKNGRKNYGDELNFLSARLSDQSRASSAIKVAEIGREGRSGSDSLTKLLTAQTAKTDEIRKIRKDNGSLSRDADMPNPNNSPAIKKIKDDAEAKLNKLTEEPQRQLNQINQLVDAHSKIQALNETGKIAAPTTVPDKVTSGGKTYNRSDYPKMTDEQWTQYQEAAKKASGAK
jgi:hypothetical protein